MRDRAIDGKLNNGDVKFYWSMVASGDWADTESMLLRMIVNHWITYHKRFFRILVPYGTIQAKKQDSAKIQA